MEIDQIHDMNMMTIRAASSIVDVKHLSQLTDHTEQGSSQLSHLTKQWEYKQANAVRLLKEELYNVTKEKEDQRELLEIYAENCDTVAYWKQKSLYFEMLMESSIKREQVMGEKLEECTKILEKQTSPVEEISQILKRRDNFLHFVLQNAPVPMGHQDNDLRYRFIYNHYPGSDEQEILGKTDVERFTGSGVKESQDFKREVLEKGIPAKREITFGTELFGSKTFLMYVEPVFSKTIEKMGINYISMDVTNQVRKGEKMLKLREEIAICKAKETELNKTIHITDAASLEKLQMLEGEVAHDVPPETSGDWQCSKDWPDSHQLNQQ